MSCTENEVTLADGASVPTTNAGPVTALVVVPVETMPLVHPVAAMAATASNRQASFENLFWEQGDMIGLFSAWFRGLC
jgi:hypothetical protein